MRQRTVGYMVYWEGYGPGELSKETRRGDDVALFNGCHRATFFQSRKKARKWITKTVAYWNLPKWKEASKATRTKPVEETSFTIVALRA